MERTIEQERETESQDNWADVAAGFDEIFDKDPALYEKIRAGYERAWRLTEGGTLTDLSEVYRAGITKIEYAGQPTKEIVDQFGYAPYLTVDKKGVTKIFETAFEQEIDWEHAFAHERTHHLLKSGVLGRINAQTLEMLAKEVGLDTSPDWEESQYILTLREQLAKNPEDKKLQRRLRLEQLTERLTFFVRAQGDSKKMFELQIGSADQAKLPDVLKSGSNTEKQAFLAEHFTAKRHQFFTEWFRRALVEQEEPEELFDEEEYELLLEELFGSGLEVAESSGFAQPSRGGGLLDWFKYVFEPILK